MIDSSWLRGFRRPEEPGLDDNDRSDSVSRKLKGEKARLLSHRYQDSGFLNWKSCQVAGHVFQKGANSNDSASFVNVVWRI
ncbi:unnamed protein product [Caenorhabditis nigoni]